VLARAGVRFGVDHVFMPALLKAAPMRLRGLLWIAAHPDLAPPPLPPEGRVSIAVDAAVPESFYMACGYRPIGMTGYRIDMLERFAAQARKLAREKVGILPPEHLSLLGINAETGAQVLRALGFKAKIEETGLTFRLRRRPKEKSPPDRGPAPAPQDSPFAKLKALIAS